MSVSYIASTVNTYIIGTSLSPAVPTGTAVDDMIVAAVMHRDTITAPAGWTLIDTITVNTGTVIQSLSMYYKIAESGDLGTSPTWTQATSQRMSVFLSTYRGIDLSIAASGKTDITSSFSQVNFPCPVVAATDIAQMAVFGATQPVIAAVNNSFSVGWTKISSNTTSENRMGVAYQNISTPDSTSGNFVSGTSGSNGEKCGVMVIIITEAEPTPDPNQRVTQVPLLLLYTPSPPVQVTQAPLLVVNLPVQGTRATQIPVLPLFTPKPIPLPMPVIPETPLTETWQWKTIVNIMEGSNEQRSRLRNSPCYILDFNVLALNDEHRRELYQLAFNNISITFPYPLYQYSVKLDQAASIGDTVLYFDTTLTDVREGEKLALFDPQLEKTYLVDILAIADGVTLASPLLFDVPAYWLACPAILFRMPRSVGITMRAIDGNMRLTLESVVAREFERPGASPTITELNGLPLLDTRPLATDVNENFNQNVTWLDNEIAPPSPRTNWPIPFINGQRSFLLKRPKDMDYWRAFAAELRGQQNPFYMPTFRDDLPLIVAPVLGATVLVTSNVQYFEFWRQAAYAWLRIERADKTFIYRRVVEAVASYDENGDAISVSITLNSSIGLAAGNNAIVKVSYVNLCRLDSDEVMIEHNQLESVITFGVRTVNA